MLNPSSLVDAVVTTLQTVPDLVLAMNGDVDNIYAHHFLYGTQRLGEVIFKMTSPSILAVYEGTSGGSFDGMTIFKHRVGCYIRAANTINNDNPFSYEDIWYAMMSGPVHGALAAANVSYGGGLTSVVVIGGGSQYTTAPTVTIDGDGSDATAHAVLTGDAVTSIVIDTPGTGYSWASVSIAPPSKQHFRSVQIIPGVVDLVDTPSSTMMQDSDGVDYMVVHLVFPEIGDQF